MSALDERGRRASLAEYRLAFDLAPVGIALVSLDGAFQLVNRALCAMVGYTSDELVGIPLRDVTHPDDVPPELAGLRRLEAGETEVFELEKRFVRKDGRVVWAMLAVSVVHDEDGAPLHFVSQALDVTDRRRAQLALERSERDLAEAQRLAGMGSWYRDLATGAATWSEELYRIFGLDPDVEMTSERFLSCVHPDDREAVSRVVAVATETGEDYATDYRIVMPTGEVRWVQSRGMAVHSAGGVVAYRGTAQDVTEHRRARAELEHSRAQLAEAEQEYRMLIEHLPLVMFSRELTLPGSNLYVSPQAEAMLGYPAQDWLTDPELVDVALHPEDRDRALAAMRRLRETGEPIRLEYRFVKPDGEVVWVEDESYLVYGADGEPLFVQGFLKDVTRRKLAEADRDQLQEELHQAQKLEAVGRLAGGIAHDFNNMLTAISGYGELLLSRLEPGSDGYEEARQVLRAVEQASTLPRQLLTFSRSQVLEPKPVDLNEIVVAAGGLLRRLLGSGIALEVSTAAAAPIALVDAAQVEQALVNLALNARDAMPAGGTLAIRTDNVRVEAAAGDVPGPRPGDYLVLAVSDTGEGMAAETKAHAFEPFFTTREHGASSGLGLASVHGVVSQSGGFIRLDSAPGEGTSVALHFPCVAADRASAAAGGEPLDAPAAATAAAAAAERDAARTILLAEDEELVRELAVRILRRAGFTVYEAADGDAALALHEELETPVDLLVTDMVMPGLNGRALAEQLRSAWPELGVVFMSGYSEETPTLGADDRVAFLAKPFPPQELVHAVEQALVGSTAATA